MKNEQHLLTVKTITAFLFPFSSRMIYLFIFLHSGSLFIQSSPAVGCWGMMHFCFFFFFSSFFSGDILRVYSKSPWQLDGNIASPSPPPPLCYFLLFLEAVLNMYEGWDWQVGFNWFWSALHEQQPALCPFCGGCFAFLFSFFLLSFLCLQYLLHLSSDLFRQRWQHFLPHPPTPPSICFLWLLICPGTAPSGDIRVSSKLNEWHVLSICPCTVQGATALNMLE